MSAATKHTMLLRWPFHLQTHTPTQSIAFVTRSHVIFMFVQAVLSVLSNELLCVNTELRVIYDAYSSRQQGKPWGWGRPHHSAALTSAQLWQLMRDCDVLEPDCSLTRINMAVAQVCLSHTLAPNS